MTRPMDGALLVTTRVQCECEFRAHVSLGLLALT